VVVVVFVDPNLEMQLQLVAQQTLRRLHAVHKIQQEIYFRWTCCWSKRKKREQQQQQHQKSTSAVVFDSCFVILVQIFWIVLLLNVVLLFGFIFL